MTKKYYSEIMLLTKSIHADELTCWLEWHLNVIHVDHIVLWDNESAIDVKSIVSKFPKDKIDYRFIKGWPNQYNLYTEYVSMSQSQWLLPLDDDEFLYLGDRYNHDMNTFISSITQRYNKNKFYILWTNLLSENKIQSKSDLYLNTHLCYSFDACRKISGTWYQDNGWGKCLINTDYTYSYKTDRCRAGHIPGCIDGDDTTILVNGIRTNIVNPLSIQSEHIFYRKDEIDINKDCFIAHYQYKTKDDWFIKCNRVSAASTYRILKNKVSVYDKIYEYQKEFKPCTFLKDMWDNYNKEK